MGRPTLVIDVDHATVMVWLHTEQQSFREEVAICGLHVNEAIARALWNLSASVARHAHDVCDVCRTPTVQGLG